MTNLRRTYNPLLISNGTCYYKIDKESSGNVIPCGNAAYGDYSCCQKGDFCLENNACYNANHSTTYLAGCTDPEFVSPNCPVKDNSEQQLLGLVQCAGTDTENGQVLWSGCSGIATKTALGAPSACSCTGTATSNGLWWAPTSLSAIASLPTAIKQTVSFASGHTPSTNTATGTSAATTTPAATASSSPVHLSTGAKAGIGIGAAVVGIILISLLLCFLTRYRRRYARQPTSEGSMPAAPDMALAQSPPPQASSPGYWPSEYGGSTVEGSEPPLSATAWSGYAVFKPELPAEPVKKGFAVKSELPAEPLVRTEYQSELPVGDHDVATARALEMQQTGLQACPPTSRTGTPVPPSEAGNYAASVSDLSSVLSSSPPQQAGQWGGRTSAAGSQHGRSNSAMSHGHGHGHGHGHIMSISELNGSQGWLPQDGPSHK